MKKIASAVLGLSLTLATAGLSLAAQNTASTPANTTGSTATNTTAKKHVKHTKKANKSAATNTATPAK